MKYINDKDLNKKLKFFIKKKNYQNPRSDKYKIFRRYFHDKLYIYFRKKSLKIKLFDLKFIFPFIKLGNVNSLNLLNVDELIIFYYYYNNKRRYKKVCDIGGNIGFHSLMMRKIGYKVDTFEPDPLHIFYARKIFKKNNININLIKKAVSNFNGVSKFTRIIKNTTGSYLLNKKKSYGPVKTFNVDVIDAKKLLNKYDLIKIDAEGSEIDILSRFDEKNFDKTDIILEISTKKNKKEFWKLMKKFKLNVFSQINSWRKVTKLNHLPDSYKKGMIIISNKLSF